MSTLMKFRQKSDFELLDDARTGCVDAFGEIVRRYEGAVRGFLRNYLFEEVVGEDIAQDVFLSLYQKVSQGEFPNYLKRWLITVAKFKAIDYLRSKSRIAIESKESLDQVVISAQFDRLEGAESLDGNEVNALHNCLDLLQPEHRELIEKFYFENQSAASIAEAEGKRSAGVRMMLLRIRKGLGKCIRKRIVSMGGAGQ